MENNYCVRTRGLTKKYSKFTLGALDLDIPEGFSTALIGANGAGKTRLSTYSAELPTAQTAR